MKDKEYIESEVWKCGKSPTNAHWWKEHPRIKGMFYCKYCMEAKHMPISYVKATEGKPIDICLEGDGRPIT